MFRKVNVVEELTKVNETLECGLTPCSVCQERLMPMFVGSLLVRFKAEAKRARQIRKVKRRGNLISFPKL